MTIFCPKYKAQITEETCLARKNFSHLWEAHDPACRQCEYGVNKINKMRKLHEIKIDMLEVSGILKRLSKRIEELQED